MSFAQDEELLQDFLIEAGELLDQLSEQLIALEHSIDDPELLNAIFRAFHTIKGGAGFLEIHSLVKVCHGAEDVFDQLRQGTCDVNEHLMDVILKAFDNVLEQMEAIRSGSEPAKPDPELLWQLEDLLKSTGTSEVQAHAPSEDRRQDDSDQEVSDSGEDTALPVETISAEQGCDSTLPEQKNESCNVDETKGDTITDDEFEALLDALHGEGTPGASSAETVTPEQPASEEVDKVRSTDEMAVSQNGDIAVGQGSETTTADEMGDVSIDAQKAHSRPGLGKAPSRVSRTPRSSEATLRVDTHRLDDIMNLVGELVLVRNRFQTLRTGTMDESLGHAVDNLNLVTSDLQSSVMKTRMQPVKKVFGRFPKVVRDLSRTLGKEIRLEMTGEDTDLDKNLVEALADPLVHLVRNALDHGIEMPDVREKAGKDRCGVLRLSACQAGDHIELSISDDGGGMDADRLKEIAISRGLLDSESVGRVSDHEAYQLIFAPGFSTKQEISDISGRGVGMDVVKTKINQLNGTLEVDSDPGTGTRINISLPLTLAIMPTLMVVVSGQVFALPLGSIVETTHLGRINIVDGQEVIMVREHPLPVVRLQEWLTGHAPGHRVEGGHVVIVNMGNRRIGLIVDQLLGQEEVVIKPLSAGLHGLPGLAGATITGDGKVSLILDIPGLVHTMSANERLERCR